MAFSLTLIHPCIGRRKGEDYIRLWQMEPLPPAVIASLTPPDVSIKFYDDRMEEIPYDQPTSLVALSIETYTAKRAYQIATEFRKRGIPVVMGGFHATLCPDEVAEYADSVVVGEAEDIWSQVIEDYKKATPKKFYRSDKRPSLENSTPDRRIFEGKNYLPVRLIEAGRGCTLKCEFCAIQTVFQRSQSRRPTEQILAEIERVREGAKLFFFIDDNIIASPPLAKEFFKTLIPLKINWVSQCTINAGYDAEMLSLMEQSGCQGVLIGFESLHPENLKKMDKGINMMKGGYKEALANFHKHHIRIYGTFVFGYDNDTESSFKESLEFATQEGFYLTGFNHLTPFPGTPLYERLENEGRLLYKKWWLDEGYSYNRLPFQTLGLHPDRIHAHCVETRKKFYSWPNILRRAFHPVNRYKFKMWSAFLLMNYMHHKEINKRDYYPLGDEAFEGPLIKCQ